MKLSKENLIWVNHLRSFITVLVVFHHSLLSYTTFANFNEENYINSTHVVVDSHRWYGLDILVDFNDIYFMSLMFLIGGLFLLKSIERKGTAMFILDRFKRLFIPFLFLGTLFMLIAYIPGYYLSKGNFDLINYIQDYFTDQKWPVGPPWFIWVLFAFNILFAFTYKFWSDFYQKAKTRDSSIQYRPFKTILGLILLTAVVYIPITFVLTTDSWMGIGPFDMQVNRLFLYLAYFFIGVFLGKIDFNDTILSSASRFVKLWKFWWILALIIFSTLRIIPKYLISLIELEKMCEFWGYLIYYTLYILSCSFTTIAMLTSFKATVKKDTLFWNSLSENAYMIYLCHFIFVVWIQFFLIELEIQASLKSLITFVLSFLASWVLSIQLRKIKMIAKYI